MSSTIALLHIDCLQKILAFLKWHQILSLILCGDTGFCQSLNKCYLDLKIRLLNSRETWQFPNILLTSKTLRRLELSSDACFFSLDQIANLSPSLTHLHIRRRGYFPKDPFKNNVRNEDIETLFKVDLLTTFPLLQSFSLLLNPVIDIPQDFIAHFGTALVELNLYHNSIMLKDIGHLPQSLTSLTCVVPTNDNDINIGDPSFPPNLDQLSLTRTFTSADHLISIYIDAVVCKLSPSITDLQLIFMASFYTTRVIHALQLDHLVNIESLKVILEVPLNNFFVTPLPIPQSATSVEYHCRMNYNIGYPFDTSKQFNMLRRLVMNGGEAFDPNNAHLLPNNLNILEWGGYKKTYFSWDECKYLPQNLQVFDQLIVDCSLETIGNGMFECVETNLPQSLERLNIRHATTAILANLPSSTTRLLIDTCARGRRIGFNVDSCINLKSLEISPAEFDMTTLVNLSNTQLDSLTVFHFQSEISTFPFAAPCLKYLKHLNIWFDLPLECNDNVLPFVTAFSQNMQSLTTLILNKHPNPFPSWMLGYLPPSLTLLDIHALSWTRDLIFDFLPLSKLESCTFSIVDSAGCINTDLIDGNFLPQLKRLNYSTSCPLHIRNSYLVFVTKMSERKSLILSPSLDSVKWSWTFGQK